jgi:phosphoribosyl-ATP pyrophosphohydrolase
MPETPKDILLTLQSVIDQRSTATPDSSYVASLFTKGRAKIAQKLGEEATETVVAAMQGDAKALTSEAADLMFHLIILLREGGVGIEDVLAELEAREGVSGHAEKAARQK